MGFIKYLFIIYLLTLGVNTAFSQENDHNIIDYSSDVMAFTLPAIAGSLTLFEKDFNGMEQAVFSLGSTYVSALFLKRIINDNRPNGERYGFPSGHTMMAFSGATFLQQRYGRKIGIPAFLLATYVGWTRIHLNEHDWQDVAGAAIIGSFISWYFTSRYKEKDLKWSFFMSKKSGFLNLSLNF